SSPTSVAEDCEGDHRPGGGVGILATIFTDPGRVALDVPWIERCAVEGRSKEQSQPGLMADELIFRSGHRARSAGGIGCPRDHAPGLGDGVDSPFLTRRRAERGSIIEKTASVPVGIPPVPLEG